VHNAALSAELSFRPIVVSSQSKVLVTRPLNAGTTLFCDGQESTNIKVGDKIVIQRAQDARLIEIPTPANGARWRKTELGRQSTVQRVNEVRQLHTNNRWGNSVIQGDIWEAIQQCRSYARWNSVRR